jgi:hypothetical protein
MARRMSHRDPPLRPDHVTMVDEDMEQEEFFCSMRKEDKDDLLPPCNILQIIS